MAQTIHCAPPIPFAWIDDSVVVPEELGIPLGKEEGGVLRLYSLRDWLQDSQYTDDEVFDCEDFHYAKQNGFAGFRRFQSFEEFSTWLQLYYEDQLCQNAPPSAEPGVSFRFCHETPLPPEEIPEEAKKSPTPPAKPKVKSIVTKKVPSGFSIRADNRWSKQRERAPSSPSSDLVIDARQRNPRPVRLEDLLPPARSGNIPRGLTYDPEKKIVTLQSHGCYVDNIYSRKCIKDWSYFTLKLQNLNRPHLIDGEKVADEKGFVAIRIPVEPGEEFRVWGEDSKSRSFVTNYYRINDRNEIVFVREEMHRL